VWRPDSCREIVVILRYGVEGLTKIYRDGVVAVNGLTFEVKEGELFGFLGPNGAGKTTTIRMLVGLTRITRGHAWICGYDVAKDHKKMKRLIGVVPDISDLYYELTCLQNLTFAARMYGLSSEKAKKNAEKILRFFDLWTLRNRKFKTLSKGLKRKLSIAAAIVHNPRVLFLDEPTSGLDVISRRLLWDKLKELNDSGVTIFLTTHNVYEAFNVASRIAVINRGKLITIDTPENLGSKFGAREILEISFAPTNPRPEEIKEIKGVISK
jgi:ABC-2 type transport system ATP-binding protein